MRVIKFRGKRILNGCWLKGDLLTGLVTNNPRKEELGIQPPTGIIYRVLEDTVGQFTGLEDCNGTPIYEGDIVTNGKHTGVVKWMQGKCCFQISPGGVFLSSRCEVIGNVYDNPEMLK